MSVSLSMDVMECPECSSKTQLCCPDCGSAPKDCVCGDKDFDTEVEQVYCSACSAVFLHVPTEYIDEIPAPVFAAGTDRPACDCEDKPQHFCGKCQVTRTYPTSPWKDMSKRKRKHKSKPYSFQSGNYGGFTQKCRHYHEEVDLGNGVKVHPSSSNTSRNTGGKTVPVPDFGLYADQCWKPTWRNEFIAWPDMSLPTDLDMACEQIKDAYLRAKDGQDVEMGCIGGHGRTGTILACMYIYASWDSDSKELMTAKDAVKKVHKDYCTHAVETDSQEWFVEYFSGHFFGTPVSEMPTKKFTNTTSHQATTNVQGTGHNGAISSPCQPPEHHAMMARGHLECVVKGKGCGYWEEDLASFPTTNSLTYKNLLNDYDLITPDGAKLQVVQNSLSNKTSCTTPCSATDHFAMWISGWETCLNRQHCSIWTIDVKAFEEQRLTGVSLKSLGEAVDNTPSITGTVNIFNPYESIKMGSKTSDGIWTPELLKKWTNKWEQGLC